MDCSAFFCRRPDDLRRAFSLVPEYLRVERGRRQPERVRLAARPPLPRPEALGDAALLRPRGPAGDHPRARPAGRALRALGRGRAGLGALRAASLLARLLPGSSDDGRARTRRSGARQRQRRDLPLAHEARRPVRAAARDRQRPHDRGRRRARLGRPPPRGASALAGSGATAATRRRRRRDAHAARDRRPCRRRSTAREVGLTRRRYRSRGVPRQTAASCAVEARPRLAATSRSPPLAGRRHPIRDRARHATAPSQRLLEPAGGLEVVGGGPSVRRPQRASAASTGAERGSPSRVSS